ncbi:hypothetical protein [Janthinobacterium fluminis]|uniref:DUF3098 domain-containing protein n=1 Tax=Janthinobacterium fluminis TaxID=2987524 RepID=A0ABT5K3G0_9BURK|nr:hypothetical protein [Janthinobacterium fluminis]MDC8759511.1 hypothetical protein [Janthinobacterium fluminis]
MIDDSEYCSNSVQTRQFGRRNDKLTTHTNAQSGAHMKENEALTTAGSTAAEDASAERRAAMRAHAKADKFHVKIFLGVFAASFVGLCTYAMLFENENGNGLLSAVFPAAVISLLIGAILLAAIKTAIRVAAHFR